MTGGKKKDSVPKISNLCSSPEKSRIVIDVDLCSSPESDHDGTPLRPIFCLKKREDMRVVEGSEDCFILDFDPDDPEISKLSVSKTLANVDSCDLSVIAEKGQVACRDYPHSRHVCMKNPFQKTPHESFCELCYCFVCDVASPCKKWSGMSGHCHAIDNEAWKLQRRAARKLFRTRS